MSSSRSAASAVVRSGVFWNGRPQLTLLRPPARVPRPGRPTQARWLSNSSRRWDQESIPSPSTSAASSTSPPDDTSLEPSAPAATEEASPSSSESSLLPRATADDSIPTSSSDDPAAQPSPPLPPTRYFGLWPTSDLKTFLDRIINAREKTHRKLDKRMPLDSDRPPRVVVLHKSELERKDGTQEIWQQIWDKFETMSREESPEYELSCDYLLHDDLAMVLLVRDCRPTGAGMTEDEREFWSLPAGSENRFSLTVLNPPRDGPVPSRERLQYASTLAATFREQLESGQRDFSKHRGRFNIHGSPNHGKYVRILDDQPKLKGRFAPKYEDDSVFHKYSCPHPRTSPPWPVSSLKKVSGTSEKGHKGYGFRQNQDRAGRRK